jgi:hypothetical protein
MIKGQESDIINIDNKIEYKHFYDSIINLTGQPLDKSVDTYFDYINQILGDETKPDALSETEKNPDALLGEEKEISTVSVEEPNNIPKMVWPTGVVVPKSLALSLNNKSCILSARIESNTLRGEHSIDGVINHEKSYDFIEKTPHCDVYYELPSKGLTINVHKEIEYDSNYYSPPLPPSKSKRRPFHEFYDSEQFEYFMSKTYEDSKKENIHLDFGEESMV